MLVDPAQLAALGVTEDAFAQAGDALDRMVEGMPGQEDTPPPPETPPPAPAPKPEPPKPAPKPAPKKEESKPEEKPKPVAAGWAAVKEAEAKNLRDKQSVAREREALKAEREALAQEKGKSTSILDELRKDPAAAFEKYVMPLPQFLDHIVKTGTVPRVPPKAEPSSEVAELKTMVQKLTEKLEARDTETKASVERDRYKAGLAKALDAEEFELLRSVPDAAEQMFTFAQRYYQEFGEEAWRALTPQDIARRLQEAQESHLRSLTSSAAARKVLGLPEPPPEGEEESGERPPPTRKPPVKKAPPNMSSSPTPAVQPAPKKPLSREDEVRAAAKLVDPDVWETMG